MTFDTLITKAKQYIPAEKISLLENAYKFASDEHQCQVRQSGEAFIEHPLNTAITLAELQLDAVTLAAALLHDVPEDCNVQLDEIEKKFGPEVSKLVDGVTRLGKLSLSVEDTTRRESQARNLRKMLVAMAEDIRVVFIKLADRLHNMMTLGALPPDKQRRIARETLEIYSPLAHRLGIWELKWQLEDQAFKFLEPDKYVMVAELLDKKRDEREQFITQVIQILKDEFERSGLRADISGRPKHIYSIYQKIEKYNAMGKRFDDIHDLMALRVLVSTRDDCYNALGIIHNLWHPIPGEFDDYISNPKPNGYQSLHTTVMCLGTTPLEIQIRSNEMHYVAEFGVAAHWRYKAGDRGGKTDDIRFEERISWLRQLIEWHREFAGAEEFLESVKTDIFNDQVFVYTPKGEIKDLPIGSTPLDFAYRVHTELGHYCIGAKINGKLVPLNTQLQNGDVVEILVAKGGKGPSRDWLRPNLGYINTTSAREKIRAFFKKQARAENIERGREALENELKRLGVKIGEREAMAKMFKYDNVDDFLAAIGYGGLSAHHIALKLASQNEQPKPVVETGKKIAPTSSISVLGVGDMLTRIAQCCQPVPGDPIIGYITRSQGVAVHRQDCTNIIHEKEKERLIEVDWLGTEAVYPATIQIEAWDRVGLVRDITSIVSDEKVNIASVTFTNHDDRTTTTMITLETNSLTQLLRLMGKLEGVRGVISVVRAGEDGTKKASA